MGATNHYGLLQKHFRKCSFLAMQDTQTSVEKSPLEFIQRFFSVLERGLLDPPELSEKLPDLLEVKLIKLLNEQDKQTKKSANPDEINANDEDGETMKLRSKKVMTVIFDYWVSQKISIFVDAICEERFFKNLFRMKYFKESEISSHKNGGSLRKDGMIDQLSLPITTKIYRKDFVQMIGFSFAGLACKTKVFKNEKDKNDSNWAVVAVKTFLSRNGCPKVLENSSLFCTELDPVGRNTKEQKMLDVQSKKIKKNYEVRDCDGLYFETILVHAVR
jgi:hypothetical protein